MLKSQFLSFGVFGQTLSHLLKHVKNLQNITHLFKLYHYRLFQNYNHEKDKPNPHNKILNSYQHYLFFFDPYPEIIRFENQKQTIP